MNIAVDPLWDDFKARAKATPILDVALRLGVKLRRVGADHVGPCPAGCATSDGFVVTPKKGIFLCRPSDATGDVIEMVVHAQGCSFPEALEFVTGETRPAGGKRETPEESDARAGKRAKLDKANERRRAAAEQDEAKKRLQEEAAIEDVLSRATPIKDTLAERYLSTRLLTPPRRLCGDLKFVADLDYWGFADSDAVDVSHIATLPAMIALIRNVAGEVIGLQETYLDPETGAKWNPGRNTRNVAKKVRGEMKGGMIRLGMVGETLAIGEGVETALSWFQGGNGPEGVSLAAAISLGNMSGGSTAGVPHPTQVGQNGKPVTIRNGVPDMERPGVILPPDVRELILIGDGDSEPIATGAAMLTGAERFAAGGLTVAVHMAPPTMDFNDVLRAPDTPATPIEDLAAFRARIAPALIPPFKSKYGAITLDHLDDPGPEFDYLIEGWLSVADKSVIGGPSKSGKSFLAIHAALCIAHNMPFFGLRVASGLVVYQAGEGARGIKKRLRAWRQYHGVEFSKHTKFVLLQSPIDIFSPDGDTGALIGEIKGIERLFGEKAALVVIDTLATAQGVADENSGKDMGAVMKNVAQINLATQAHVQLVHHMNAGGNKLRGHTSIYANVDQVVLVTRNEVTRVRTAVLDKQKDDEEGSRFQFELKSIALGADARDRPITSCICLPVGEKDAIARGEEAKGFVLRGDETLFMQAFFAAQKTHGEPVPATMDLGPDIKNVVPYGEIKRLFAGMSPVDDVAGGVVDADHAQRHREMLKKKLMRTRIKLIEFGVLGVQGNFVWHTGKPLRAFPKTLPKKVAEEHSSPGGFAEMRDSIPF